MSVNYITVDQATTISNQIKSYCDSKIGGAITVNTYGNCHNIWISASYGTLCSAGAYFNTSAFPGDNTNIAGSNWNTFRNNSTKLSQWLYSSGYTGSTSYLSIYGYANNWQGGIINMWSSNGVGVNGTIYNNSREETYKFISCSGGVSESITQKNMTVSAYPVYTISGRNYLTNNVYQ